MLKASKTELQKALKTLQLSNEATKKDVIERTKTLEAAYETETTLEASSELAEIRNARCLLLAHHESLNNFVAEAHASKETESLVTADTQSPSFFQEYQPYTPKTITLEQKKRWFKIKLAIATIVVLLGILSVPFGISRHRENTYDELRALMMDAKGYHMDAIGERIDALPDGYEDVDTIATHYQTIKADIQIIETNDILKDYERMRRAYYDLVSTDEAREQWDLTEYLNSVDKKILLLENYWHDEQYYFHFSIGDSNQSTYLLSTNLPNEKEPQSDYYFYGKENYSIIGYRHKANVIERFEAYEIQSIEEEAIIIYCFSNNKTYELTL